MTKREFITLKEGDQIIPMRHILDEHGKIVVHENSLWKVEEIKVVRYKGQGRKPLKTALLSNVANGHKYKIGKENSANFVIQKKKNK
jgi:hypothetical protein